MGGTSHYWQCYLWAAGPECVRKQAELDLGSKPVAVVPASAPARLPLMVNCDVDV